MGVGKNIEDLAELKGISLRQVAIKAGIPYNTLYSIVKRDSKRISRDTLVTVSEALGIDSMDLYNYAESSGGCIRFARLAAGLTHKQLAKEMGITVEALIQYESNEKKLSIDAIKSFSKALNISPAYVMGCVDKATGATDIYGVGIEIAKIMNISPLLSVDITEKLGISADTIEEFDEIASEAEKIKSDGWLDE